MDVTKEDMSTNVAKRLRDVLAKARSFEGKRSVMQVWMGALSGGDRPPNDSARLVTQRLGYVLDEIDRMDSALRAASIPLDDLTLDGPIGEWKTALQRCLLGLQTPWSNCAADFKQHLYTALDFWCCILPDSETQLPSEDLQELADTLRRVLGDLEKSDLTPEFHGVVKVQLQTILSAIYEYGIRGDSALKSALREVGANLADHADLVKENFESEGMSKLAEGWNEILRVTKPILDRDSLLRIMYRMEGMAGEVLKLVSGSTEDPQ